MARTTERLSAAKVSKAKPGMHCDGGGLYLQASLGADGEIKKSWIFRFALGGRERQMGLGSLRTVSLAEAREKATGCRKQVAEGVDPIEARDVSRAAAAARNAKSKSFDECAAEYITAQRAGWTNAEHRQQWTNTLNDLRVASARQAAGGGDRRRSRRQGAAADLGEEAGDRQPRARPHRGRPRLGDGKEVAAGRQPGPLARATLSISCRERSRVVEHLAALPYAEIGAFMVELGQREGVARPRWNSRS